MVKNSKDQWIEERREKFKCPYCGEVIACSKEGVLGLYSAKIFRGHQEACQEAKMGCQ